jgi:uncharacterized cupin superfamily protein
MDGYLVKGSIGMPRGSLLRIDDGAGMLVYVWEGELWLTQEGSRKDHMLQAGQWFRVERDGAALAHAFRNSVVSLSSPVPEVPAERIALSYHHNSTPVVLHRRAESAPGHVLRQFLAGLSLRRATGGFG